MFKLMFYLNLTFFICWSNFVEGQSISRQVIGSCGNTGNIGNQIIQQTVGQPASTTVVKNDDIILRQGFHQPSGFYFIEDSQSCEFILSPNPNDGNFNINLPTFYHGAQLVIINTEGKLLVDKSIVSGISTHSLGNLVNGVYILKLTTLEGFVCEKRAIINN